MILIDAIYINNGGGKVLLDYLMQKLESSDLNFFYLLDKRVEGNHIEVKSSNNVVYQDASLNKRYQFYRNNKNSFSAILCFGNIPPMTKCKAKVFTYFHQPMYLSVPSEFSFFQKIKFSLKIKILKKLLNNTDFWLVQNQRIKDGLIKKFNISSESISVIPFYPSVKSKLIDNKIDNTYLYVSNATPHKNHKRLIDAFCKFYDKNNLGQLSLTIGDDFYEILQYIIVKQKLGYPIRNLGFLNHTELAEIYGTSQFLIFPSLAESFGLGLVEAIENDCNVIASDLEYTYAVCIPSLVFDPFSVESIEEALQNSLNNEFPKSKSVVKNNIDKIIDLLNK